MRIMLAPMEGVIDAEMRAVLTAVGGFDRCVTEFVRVTEQLIPNHVFFRYCPELREGGTTPAGVPVYLQLLGGSWRYMALNAQRAQRLSPAGIDLNFGCPSKTVNRSDGGSALLREPQRVGDIVKAVRDAVDPGIPVTAKIRLGFSNDDLLSEIVEKIASAGASELCVHARTREDRYKPPAFWHKVMPARVGLTLPIIINGEIWSPVDAVHAQTASGCTDIMLGRGAMARPDLAAAIKAQQATYTHASLTWHGALELLIDYLENTQNKHPMFVGNRAKQWLVFLQMQYSPAKSVFHRIKRLKVASDVLAELDQCLQSEHPISLIA